MSVSVSYARVLGVRTVEGRTLLDVAVQTDEGEIRPGEIDGTNVVFADSLVVGIVTGSRDSGQTFRPMRHAGGGGSGNLKPAIIVSSRPIGEDLFEYQIKGVLPIVDDGGDDVGSARSWEIDEASPIETAYNTAERVPFNGFSSNPVATGTGVLVSKLLGYNYFSMSNVEGACQGPP